MFPLRVGDATPAEVVDATPAVPLISEVRPKQLTPRTLKNREEVSQCVWFLRFWGGIGRRPNHNGLGGRPARMSTFVWGQFHTKYHREARACHMPGG